MTWIDGPVAAQPYLARRNSKLAREPFLDPPLGIGPVERGRTGPVLIEDRVHQVAHQFDRLAVEQPHGVADLGVGRGAWRMAAIRSGHRGNRRSKLLGNEFEDFRGLAVDVHGGSVRSWFLRLRFRLDRPRHRLVEQDPYRLVAA